MSERGVSPPLPAAVRWHRLQAQRTRVQALLAGTWDDRVRLAVPALLTLGALLLRLQTLDTGPWGDEAYYYFIARHLTAYFDVAAYPVSGSVVSPVHPLFFHLFAATLESARVANALVGSALVPLSVLILRRLEVSTPWQWAAGGLVAVHPILVQFSSLVLVDMLGTVIAATALLAHLSRRPVLAAVLAALAVLEKEYFVFFAAALFVDWTVRERRVYWAMLASGSAALAWLGFRFGIQHAPLQYLLAVHAHDALTPTLLEWMVGSATLVPLILVGALGSPRLLPATLFLATFLGFLTFWGSVEIWYLTLPAFLGVLLACYGGHLLVRWAGAAPWRFASNAAAAWLALVTLAVAASGTLSYLQGPHDHTLAQMAGYLDTHAVGGPVDLYPGCFWAYRYYPLSAPGRTVGLPASPDAITAPHVISCQPATAPRGWRTEFQAGPYTLFSRTEITG